MSNPLDEMLAGVDWQKVVQVLVSRNPEIANNPRAKYMLDVIASGDNQKGEELARNLCSSFGATQEDGTNMAMQWLRNLVVGGNNQ